MPGHLLLIFGSSLPLSVPRHRHKKKSQSQLPVRPGTVPAALVYLVGFFKALRSAALSLPLELVQTLFKLSARTFFLRSRLHVPFTPLCFLTSPPSLDHFSIIFPSCRCWLRPQYPCGVTGLVALSQPTLLPRGEMLWLLPLRALCYRRQHPRLVLPTASHH